MSALGQKTSKAQKEQMFAPQVRWMPVAGLHPRPPLRRPDRKFRTSGHAATTLDHRRDSRRYPSPMPAPIALTDSQLDAVVRASQPLAPADRGRFLEAVAEALRGREIGDGAVYLAIAEAQRQFWIRRSISEPARGAGRGRLKEEEVLQACQSEGRVRPRLQIRRDAAFARRQNRL
jgi:hypothetical protein